MALPGHRGLMTRLESVVSDDGTPIAYERRGEGPPLVLVHGTTADHTRWGSSLPLLAERFTTYAVDRRGRGASGDTGPYSIEREYEDVAAVVRSIRAPVNLLGHSYGALLCLEAALRVGNLRRLVLYEPGFPVEAPLYPPGLRERYQAMLDAGDREGMMLAFYREMVGMSEDEIAARRSDPSWPERLAAAPTVLREFADGEYRFDPSRFRALEIPTLLLLGGESPEILTAPSRAIHGALPRSRIAVMPGQKHLAMFDAPELFVRLVTEFLDQAP